MKRLIIALLALAFVLSLFTACAMKSSPVKNKNSSVSVNSQNTAVQGIVTWPQTVTLTDTDAQEFISYLDQLEDGREHICDCTADVCVVIGEQTFYYHSHSGVLTEEGDETNIYYVGNNREAINDLLRQYITLRP